MTAQTAPTLELLQLKPSQINSHPKNPRAEVTDLGGLVESVKQVGILEPVVVAPWPSDLPTKSAAKRDGYVLIAGHRRCAAAKEAKVTVPAILREDLSTLAAQIGAMLIENLHRSDLSAVEEGDAYQSLLDLDVSQADIAESVGRPKRVVSERVRVAGLPPTAREKLHNHQITLEAALNVAEFKDDPAAQATLMNALGSWQWSQTLDRLRDQKKAVAARAKTRRVLEKQGVRVLDEEPDGEYLEVTELPGDICNPVMAHHNMDADEMDESHYHEWHRATCEGHAVIDTGRKQLAWQGGQYEFVTICTTLDAHPAPEQGSDAAEQATGPAGSGPASPSPEEVEAAEAMKVGMQEAREARSAHIAHRLNPATPASDAAEALLIQQILQHVATETRKSEYQNPKDQVAVLRVWFGLTGAGETWTEGDKDGLHQWLASASLAHLVLAFGFVERLRTEIYITSPRDLQPHSESHGYGLEYFRLLAKHTGYQWTDFEADLVPDWLKPTTAQAVDADAEGGEVA